MTFSADDLAATLANSPESSYVRVVADWLTHGELSVQAPATTSVPVVDALVAAASAQLARNLGLPAPRWTHDPSRTLESFWHPGSDRFFAYSLAHTPAEFFARGVIIEADSLKSV